MTLPFLTEGVRTANQIPNLWSTSLCFDSIEASVHNGDRLKYLIDQIDNVFYVKLEGNDYYVCLVIVLVGDKEPKRFIIRDQMAADLVNHVNRQKFIEAMSFEDKVSFWQSCK